MIKQPTAVEWLIQELDLSFRFQNFEEVLEQAKALEKEQVCNFAEEYYTYLYKKSRGRGGSDVEQYYNEKYNQSCQD